MSQVKVTSHKKHCRRVSLHSCGCWLLQVETEGRCHHLKLDKPLVNLVQITVYLIFVRIFHFKFTRA